MESSHIQHYCQAFRVITIGGPRSLHARGAHVHSITPVKGKNESIELIKEFTWVFIQWRDNHRVGCPTYWILDRIFSLSLFNFSLILFPKVLLSLLSNYMPVVLTLLSVLILSDVLGSRN